MCTINKSTHTEKSGNLFNEPHTHTHIYIYIYIYIHLYQMSRPTKRFVFFSRFIHFFVLTYVYDSSLLLSSDNIHKASVNVVLNET